MSSTELPPDWTRPFADLSGKRVLITGASRGIGAAVAAGFCQCGAHVGVHYGQSAVAASEVVAGIRAAGGQATALAAQLDQPEAPRQLIDAAASALGGLDVLVLNAGSPYGRVPIDQMPQETYRRIMRLNLDAVVECVQHAVPLLSRSAGAAIVLTSSIAARTGGGRGVAAYAAAKAAVEGLTRALAKELAPAGIRVNCIAPGYILTGIHDGFSSEDDRDGYLRVTPLARGGSAEEMVGAFLFLASARTASFITGQTLAVNGGLAS
jgi:3-oxoacyl-[acyl-carrier protein] reductase